MDIFETNPFSRIRDRYFDESSYVELTWHLFNSPRSGDVIPGTGGVRKLRWQQPGRGKSGGARVIYYIVGAQSRLYLITAYAKNEVSDLPRDVLNKIRESIDE